MKILVTGGAGYIGSKLVAKLLQEGYQTRVLDSLVFGGESLSSFYGNPGFEFIRGDIRDKFAVDKSLQGTEAVIHLAATVIVSGSESAAELQRIQEINYKATAEFVDLCKERKVQRFIFTSTCSNYGISDPSKPATEADPLNPTSPYAVAKVDAEKYILKSASPTFHPTVLRLATVFGVSPAMRFESLLNQLVRDAAVQKSLLVYGPLSWRPFVHINDVVQAILLVLRAPLNLVSGEVFNVGANSLNYQKAQLVELIRKNLPETKVEIKGGAADPRSYRVSFDKITKVLGFQATKGVEEGILEMKERIEKEFSLIAKKEHQK